MTANQGERIAFREINVGFVDHQQTPPETTRKNIQIVSFRQGPARRIRTAHYRKLGAFPRERLERGLIFGLERNRDHARFLDGGQRVVQRVRRLRVGNAIAMAERRPEDHRKQLVGTIARNDLMRGNAIEARRRSDKGIRSRRRVEPQCGARVRNDRPTHAGRRRVRILVGVEFDQALPGTRLLSGRIWRHPFNRFAKHPLLFIRYCLPARDGWPCATKG